MATYFQAHKARSVAVLGANNPKLFFKDKPTLVENEDDIFIFRRKTDVIFECNENSRPIANEVTGQDAPVIGPGAPVPLSRSTYQGHEGAKRKQLMAEQSINEQEIENEKARKSKKTKAKKKKDIETELSEEDDLSVSDDDFDFEDEKKEEEPKKKKSKSKAKKKKATAKKKGSAKKTAVKKSSPKKAKPKKKTGDFKKKKNILDSFSS